MMIGNRRRNFIGNILNDEIFTVVLYFMTFNNMCLIKCVLTLVFFFVSPKIDHGSVAPFGDRYRRHWGLYF